jgi:hypothetical protein
LSLDHGRAQLLTSLLVLKKMMQKLSTRRGLTIMAEPWQVFNLIGEVGTSGVIAILLGHLHMNLSDYIDKCMEISLVFDTPPIYRRPRIAPPHTYFIDKVIHDLLAKDGGEDTPLRKELEL